MAQMKWTPAQEAAIYDRGGSLLLSAAAGSGKTAVLTERVVQLLQDTAHPIQADRLLIVTFTNAAAAELRARIAARIEQVLVSDPQNNHLRRQKMLLQRAHICTIDAFCLQLVQQHFTALDIPPDFALADAGVVEKLKSDALAKTLEDAYQNPAFCDFVNMYGKGRSDGAASAAILQLYDFLRTEPNETEFLARMTDYWNPAQTETVDAFCESLGAEVGDKANLGDYFAKTALSLCEFDFEDAVALAIESKKTPVAQQKAEAKVTVKYQKILAVVEEIVDAFAAVAPFAQTPVNWEGLYQALQPYREGCRPMPGLTGRGVRLTGANGARAKQAADKASALFAKILALVPCTRAQDNADRTLAHPMIIALCAAQQQFAALFYQRKIEKKVLEFSDLEQLTLQLLHWENAVPSPLASAIAANFDAVMVDEYQDTNRLQDLIYRRLANPAGDNLFFVGDIKQSIYRFRKADPSIFGAKLRLFAPLAAGKARSAPPAGQAGENALLALDANFRSTEAVVGGINFIFEALMNDFLGGTRYGDGQRLVCKGGGDFAGSTNLLIDPEGGQDPAQVADKIAQLIALGAAGDVAGMVRQGSELRPVRYEDCCILLSTRAPFAKYAAALAERGIAVYADSAEDLLSVSHIQPLVALLQIIDNPAQDIPLAAAMLSVIFGFTEDDLLALRLRSRKGSLYGAVVKVAAQARKA
ncbi:MAG: UvrD-helicase domain-containing protein, partial [Faecalibacterium sp.]